MSSLDLGVVGNCAIASLIDRNTQLLCYAMSNGISSNCRDINNPNDRNFCYAVSSHSNSYCASIIQ